MSTTLLITNDDRRARRISDGLDLPAQALIFNLYGDTPPGDRFDLIIVDVDSLDSLALVRLLSVLEAVRRSDIPLLFLAHGNPARARTQAGIIRATETMPTSTAPQTLRAVAGMLLQRVSATPTSAAVRLASEARQFLVEVFFSGATVTPELATTGSDLIARAVAESGVRNWVSAVRQFDNATHQHCLLVAGLSASFATSLGLGRMQSFRLTKAALLHDVGKTVVPLSILNKPGRLTAEEIAIMRTHSVEGYEMLKDGGFSNETLAVVRSHHELLDGSGYPDGLREDEIPDLVRLVTVCDIFGALVERRSYKPPLPAPQAFSIIAEMTGRLDSNLVAAFRPVAEAMT